MLAIDDLHKRMAARVHASPALAKTAIHIVDTVIPHGTTLTMGRHRYTVDKDAYVVVIDEDPDAYWAHPVRYELHDVDTGAITVLHEKYPLARPVPSAKLLPVHEPPGLATPLERGFFDSPRFEPGITTWKPVDLRGAPSYGVARPCASHKHALFVAGLNNMPDFHHDFVNMRSVLVDRYGYDPANIVVVMGDGSSYPDLPVTHTGTTAGLDAALDAYAAGGSKPLGAGDSLFLYTFNHGDTEGTSSLLCMHPATSSVLFDPYYDHELRAKLDRIHCGQLLVAMNQCRSGGFIPEVLASTGSPQIAIMTACSGSQNAHRAAGSSNGYFSVALCAALNWAFPSAIAPSFPGYIAGAVTAQDTSGEGAVSMAEAFAWVQARMSAFHSYTMSGTETPQWGESSPGAGALLFWGRPSLAVPDGVPMWESPEVFLHDPAVVPTDASSATASPSYWADNYHPDTVNRVVARVYNTGCAPCRNVTVEFRMMSSGIGSAITLIGTAVIDQIDPGHHAYAWVDWGFPSTMIHRCALARASCAADPAMPFSMSNIGLDDAQAQRNLDPLYLSPRHDGEWVVERTVAITNKLGPERVLRVDPQLQGGARGIKAEVIDVPEGGRIMLKPGDARTMTVRFQVQKDTPRDVVQRFPIAFKEGERVVGGVTFTVQIADGRIEGRAHGPRGPATGGRVTIEHIKIKGVKLEAPIRLDGRFSFAEICPGPYRVTAVSPSGIGNTSVFAAPNRVTRLDLALRPRLLRLGAVLKDAAGRPRASAMVRLRDPRSGEIHVANTDVNGVFVLRAVEPGDFEVIDAAAPGRRITVGALDPE